jgi:hypothetical protein
LAQAGHVNVDGAISKEIANGQTADLRAVPHTAVSMHTIEPFEEECISVSWRPGPSPLQRRSPSCRLKLGDRGTSRGYKADGSWRRYQTVASAGREPQFGQHEKPQNLSNYQPIDR